MASAAPDVLTVDEDRRKRPGDDTIHSGNTRPTPPMNAKTRHELDRKASMANHAMRMQRIAAERDRKARKRYVAYRLTWANYHPIAREAAKARRGSVVLGRGKLYFEDRLIGDVTAVEVRAS